MYYQMCHNFLRITKCICGTLAINSRDISSAHMGLTNAYGGPFSSLTFIFTIRDANSC